MVPRNSISVTPDMSTLKSCIFPGQAIDAPEYLCATDQSEHLDSSTLVKKSLVSCLVCLLEQDLVDRIFVEQIKELEVAEDIMTAPVQTCGPTETVDDIAK